MNKDILDALLKIAGSIAPSLTALAERDKSGQLTTDIVAAITTVVGKDDPAIVQTVLNGDPAIQEGLKKELIQLVERRVELERQALEKEQRSDLKKFEAQIQLADEEHKNRVEEIKKNIESTDAARAFALSSAKSERWWIAAINPIVSIVIVLSFIGFIFLIARNELTPSNSQEAAQSAQAEQQKAQQTARKELFLVAFGALATAFATVIGFHFGASSGSQQKAERQRLYGTRGLLDSQGQMRPGDLYDVPQTSSGITNDGKAQASHPFEAFWMKNLSHIQHFNWKEFLFLGASNNRFKSNREPNPTLYPNVVPLVNVLEAIRKEVNAPVRLLSIYRSPEYNKDIGGAQSSRHMQFDAADFEVLGPTAGTPEKWRDVAKTLRDRGMFRGGIGVYKTFVHVDTRGRNEDWTGA